MRTKIHLKAEMQPNCDLNITVKKATKVDYKPYLRMGQPGYTNIKGSDQTMNAYELVLRLTVARQINLLSTLTENMDPDTNVSIIRSKNLSKTEKSNNSRAFNELKKLNIVRRIRREHYMINPDFIVPSGLVMSRAYLQEKYNKLKK